MKHFTIDPENNITLHVSRKAARETGASVFSTEEQFADAIGNDNPRLLEIWNCLPGVKPVTKFTNRKTATERIFKAIQNLGGPSATAEPEAAHEMATEPVARPPQLEAAPESVAPPSIDEPTIPSAEPQQEPSVVPAERVAEPTTPFDQPVASVSAQAADVAPVDAKPIKKTTRTKKTPTCEPAALVTPKATQPATAPEATAETVASVGAHGADDAPEAAAPTQSATRAKKTPSDAPKPKATREGSKTDTILGLLKRPGGASLKEIMEATSWQAHSVRGFVSGMLTKKMGLSVVSAKSDTGERTYLIKA